MTLFVPVAAAPVPDEERERKPAGDEERRRKEAQLLERLRMLI